jgi:hypothetical protein
MFGKPPRQFHDIRFLHRVDDLDTLLVGKVMVKLTDTIEIAVDRLGL